MAQGDHGQPISATRSPAGSRPCFSSVVPAPGSRKRNLPDRPALMPGEGRDGRTESLGTRYEPFAVEHGGHDRPAQAVGEQRGPEAEGERHEDSAGHDDGGHGDWGNAREHAELRSDPGSFDRAEMAMPAQIDQAARVA